MEIPAKYLAHLPKEVAALINDDLQDGESATFRLVRGCVRHIEGDEDELYYRGHTITRDECRRGFSGHYTVGSVHRGEMCDTLTEAKAFIDRKVATDG